MFFPKSFKCLLLGLLSAMALGIALQSHAQTYPNRPIKLVTTAPPGTGPDLLARLLATSMSTALGQAVVVESKVGANGNIAADFVAKSPADGYTLLIGSDAVLAINPHIYARLPFNPQTDFVPLATLISQELFLVLNPAVPAKNLKEFIELARKSNPPLSYGSASSGSQSHLAMEILKSRTGINLMHIPYKSGAAASLAAMSGEVSAVFGATALKPQIAAGKLKALATTGPKRSPGLPDVPTVGETIPGFEGLLWIGLLAPAGTPPTVVAIIRDQVQKFLLAPESVEKLSAAGFDPFVTTPDDFRELIKNDYAKYGQVTRAANLKVD